MEDIEKVYEQTSNLVYRYLLSLCHDSTVAEDLMQETFLKAVNRINTWRGDSKLETWLCAIAKNEYLQWLRKKKETTELPMQSESRRDEDQDFDYIYNYIHRLKDPYKEVLLLRHFGGLPYRRIADIFSKSENWARVTYYRAKEMLRKELEENGET